MPVAAATRRAASPRAVPAGDEPLDLGRARRQRVVRGGRRRGSGARPPRPPARRRSTNSPRSVIVAVRGPRRPARRAAPRTISSWSFVSSRQTRAGRSAPQAAARSRSVAASRVGRLEQDRRPLVGGDPRQPLPPLAAASAAGTPRTPSAARRRPLATTAASTADAPGIGHDRAALGRPRGDELVARVADAPACRRR